MFNIDKFKTRKRLSASEQAALLQSTVADLKATFPVLEHFSEDEILLQIKELVEMRPDYYQYAAQAIKSSMRLGMLKVEVTANRIHLSIDAE